jgi:hypothetical protein
VVRRLLDCTIATQYRPTGLDPPVLVVCFKNKSGVVATQQHRITLVQQKEFAPLRFMNQSTYGAYLIDF